MKKVTLSGGFHNVSPICVNVSERAFLALDDVKNGFSTLGEWAECHLSQWQKKRLEAHFCGIKGCKCGSYSRSTIE